VAIGVDRVERAWTVAYLRVAGLGWTAGLILMMTKRPLLGFDRRVPGFFWCAGQGGYGIQSAPALARTAEVGW
jgi:D-arginine dehydrogenase